MTEVDELQKLASLARRSLEPGFPIGATCAPNSAGACLHACLVLVVLMTRFGSGFVSVRGGSDGAGAQNKLGQWCGHYWTVVAMPSGSEFIVDITADQFGHEPVVVMAFNDASHRYRDGPQDEVDAAFDEIAREFGCEDFSLELSTKSCIVN